MSRPRPFPSDHAGHDVWPLVLSKSPKPHIRVTSANCGNPDCACQTDAEASR